MKVRAPKELEIELWREFRESGLDCRLVDEYENADFELFVDERSNAKGVQTQGQKNDLTKMLHQDIITSLSELNPQWTEDDVKTPMYKRPKDLGITLIEEGVLVTVFASDKVERDRLLRNRAKLVRAIVRVYETLKDKSSDTI